MGLSVLISPRRRRLLAPFGRRLVVVGGGAPARAWRRRHRVGVKNNEAAKHPIGPAKSVLRWILSATGHELLIDDVVLLHEFAGHAIGLERLSLSRVRGA